MLTIFFGISFHMSRWVLDPEESIDIKITWKFGFLPGHFVSFNFIILFNRIASIYFKKRQYIFEFVYVLWCLIFKLKLTKWPGKNPNFQVIFISIDSLGSKTQRNMWNEIPNKFLYDLLSRLRWPSIHGPCLILVKRVSSYLFYFEFILYIDKESELIAEKSSKQ